jgi:hypothetical protein
MDMDDALELTERVEDDEPVDLADDLMIMDREPEPEPEPEPEFERNRSLLTKSLWSTLRRLLPRLACSPLCLRTCGFLPSRDRRLNPSCVR